MPLITIQMIQGRTIDQKRLLVDKITKTVCEVINTKPEKVRIVFADLKPEDYAISGNLYIDTSI